MVCKAFASADSTCVHFVIFAQFVYFVVKSDLLYNVKQISGTKYHPVIR